MCFPVKCMRLCGGTTRDLYFFAFNLLELREKNHLMADGYLAYSMELRSINKRREKREGDCSGD